ncbi:hypothetical protein MYX65_10755 [Acidobacteria bacterium AH-259-L09]|nr:hypothetical protein [Acidobacteria bacterium AH-259-L09]
MKNYAEIKGFSSLASYIRYVALDQDFVIRQKIFEIHAHLLGNQENLKKKKFKKNLVKTM